MTGALGPAGDGTWFRWLDFDLPADQLDYDPWSGAAHRNIHPGQSSRKVTHITPGKKRLHVFCLHLPVSHAHVSTGYDCTAEDRVCPCQSGELQFLSKANG